MRAGKLDRIVEIWRADHRVNEAGTPVMTWEKHLVLRAEVIRLSTVEVLRTGTGAVDEAELLFRTRFMPGLTTADRAFFDGRFYKLKTVDTIGRNVSLEMRALALEPEGAAPAEDWGWRPIEQPS